ncbi:MAG: AAA family ATPase, partial [Treponema sp.]|nr:AAA family ATPase [Treponema sp.]
MGRNYWRIGIEHIELGLFEEGYPYFWGGAVTGIIGDGNPRKAYINRLPEVRIGDILVAGGTKNIKYVGEIISTPVYLFEEGGPKNGTWDKFGISEADFETQEIFKPYEDDGYSDVVCIKTKWFKIDCSQLKMPESQTLGSFTSLNESGKKYIESVLSKESIMNGVTIENCLHLLQANKNLILTGAPGTGKTYLAKQIAQQMLFGEAKDEEKLDDKQRAFFKEHCGFVQFHPSYDYTDFVEGLRPTPPSDNGQIGFE